MQDKMQMLKAYIKGMRDSFDEVVDVVLEDADYISEYEKGYLRALNNIISVINTLEKEAEHGKKES